MAYTDHCDYLYIIVPNQQEAEWVRDELKASSSVKKSAGVMYLDPVSGLLVSAKPAKLLTTMSEETRWGHIMKMAWRTGLNASNTRRTRVFLPETVKLS